jgi:hypothetical protein
MKFKEEFERKNAEIEKFKSENENLKHLLRSYEDSNLKNAELEKVIRVNNSKYEKSLGVMSLKISELNKQVLIFEGRNKSSLVSNRANEDKIENVDLRLNVCVYLLYLA